jgi:hypothetical protein
MQRMALVSNLLNKQTVSPLSDVDAVAAADPPVATPIASAVAVPRPRPTSTLWRLPTLRWRWWWQGATLGIAAVIDCRLYYVGTMTFDPDRADGPEE